MHRAQRNQLIRRVKITVINIVLLVIAVFIIHNTLPPDQIQGYTVEKMDLSFLDGHPKNAMSIDYAKWKYRNYVLIKYARSDVLGVTLVGAPFQMWKIDKLDD